MNTRASAMYATPGFAGASDEADIEKAMREGSKDANSTLENQGVTMEGLIRSVIAELRAGLKVNVSPTSTTGRVVARSLEAVGPITGEIS